MTGRSIRAFPVGLLLAAALVAADPVASPAPAAPGSPPPAAAPAVPTPPPGPAGVAVLTEEGAWVEASLQRGEDPADAFVRLALEPEIDQVSFTWTYAQHGTVPVPPDDPIYPRQWHLPAADVPGAWAVTDGAGVVIAVLDSGIIIGADLACRQIIAPYNAITQTSGLAATADDTGHGSLVAAIAQQCTDNGLGTAGVAPGTALMPVKVLEEGTGTSLAVARGIDWAVANGADVINLSLGGSCGLTWPHCRDAALDAAIAAATAAGIVVVASAGNDGSAVVSYPAGHPDVIAVGASTREATRSFYSNHGSALDLLAPGEQILSLGPSGLVSGSGTSFSAPIVAGVAALVRSRSPEMTPPELRTLLRTTALDVGLPGWDLEHGAGIIRAAAAVGGVPVGPPETPSPMPEAAPPPSPGVLPLGADGVATVDTGGRWQLRDLPGGASPIGGFYYGNPGDLPFMGDWDCDGLDTPGLYRQSDGYVYLRNSNTQGNADTTFFFGNPGDLPLVGDFDGDGCDSVSLYRPDQARIYIVNALGRDGGGLGTADFSFGYGNSGDVPFVGDFDGDGSDSVGLYRSSTARVYLRNALSAGPADVAFLFGDPGDQILAGDWDGDGDDTLAVYRPATEMLYVRLENSSGVADSSVHLGAYPHAVAS